MLAGLRRRKEAGGDGYPCSIWELAEEAEPGVDAALVLKAAGGKKPFGENAVVLQPKNIASPVALKGDESTLLRDDRTLLFLVELACTEANPTVDAMGIKSKLPKALRGQWSDAVSGRLEEGRMPQGIALLTVGRKRLLHRTCYPLPPPPEEILAKRLIAHLQSRRQEAGYPMPLAELQRSVAEGAAAALVKKALACKLFKEAVVFGMTAKPSAPLALAEDRERLGRCDLLFLEALRAARSGSHQVVNPADLKKKVTGELHATFVEALAERDGPDALPKGVGCLIQKKAKVFFLIEDVVRGTRSGVAPDDATKASVANEGDFATRFEKAFTELDRAKGDRNFVSLVDLRSRVPENREAFDEGLRRLRREGKFTLSASEGRHGLTPAELEAGVREEGAHFLYVSRKK